jgi:UDP-glucose 4-epimerase
VVHLAARYGRLLCRDEPHRAVSDNAAATTELAQVCAEAKIPVLYASSSEVYGDHGEDRVDEHSELRTPTTIYGLSKRWGEEVLRLYLPESDLTIVRLNMLYGPDQRAGYGCCALATFIDSALKDQPFTVHPETTRSWLYISDAVRALRILIDDKHRGVFNCSNDREYLQTSEVARMACEAVGANAGKLVQYETPPAHQIRHKRYASTKLQNQTGWAPEVSLEDGLEKTVGWMIEHGTRDYAMAA